MEYQNTTGIQLHLITGHKLLYYQQNAEISTAICNDLDGHIFSRASLVIESIDHVTSVPGNAMIGITVLVNNLPDSFLEREKLSGSKITQISPESFQLRRLRDSPRVEGHRSPTLSEIEFVSGEHLFHEINEVAVNGLGERDALHHLFKRPSLSCRRLEGGFSIWNTAHIVSWTHFPKLEVPNNAWAAEALVERLPGELKIVNLV